MSQAQTNKRWAILMLQIVAIVVLLTLVDDSFALSIPKKYKKNPPDKGFTYKRTYRSSDGSEEKSVWVPGLTDNMNEKSRRAYHSMKKQDSQIVWKQRRKQVANIIQYTQDNPKAKCETKLNGTATMAYLVCKSPGGKSKSFANAVASQFDKYLDESMVTPSEGASFGVVGETTTDKAKSVSRKSSSRQPASSQFYRAPVRGRFGESLSNGSAYSGYISSRVAPRSIYSNRDSKSVFATGGEEFLLLKDQQAKKNSEKLAPAQPVSEQKKPAPKS